PRMETASGQRKLFVQSSLSFILLLACLFLFTRKTDTPHASSSACTRDTDILVRVSKQTRHNGWWKLEIPNLKTSTRPPRYAILPKALDRQRSVQLLRVKHSDNTQKQPSDATETIDDRHLTRASSQSFAQVIKQVAR
ncbi:hypothetical protein X777_01654, partial [Ooceraea biroi]